MLPSASIVSFIVDPIVDVATDIIDATGVFGVFFLMLLESACIPVPSEAIMLFAGFVVSDGTNDSMTLATIVIAGVLGNVVGSWVAWWVGKEGRIELLEKNRLVHINPKHLAAADRWFERYGDWAVFFSRMLPIVRTFISLPAGVARMPFWRFTWLTLLGCIPFVLALGIIGVEVGDRWEDWRHKLAYFDYPVAAAILIAAGYLVWRWRRNGGDASEPEPAPERT